MSYWIHTYEAWSTPRQTPWGMIDHLRIRRRDGKEITITWDLLQKIKQETVGDITMIEVYPETALEVNDINCRHFWEVPIGVMIPGLHDGHV